MPRIFLTDLTADVSGYKLALVDQRNPDGGALTTSVTNITSAASVGATNQATDTAGGTALSWITKPMLADVAIDALPVLCNVWGLESNADANVGIQLRLAEYTSSQQSAFLTSTTNSSELGTAAARRAWETSNPTATTIDAGNRLVVELYAIALDTTGNSRTMTIDYDGPTGGADGDTYIVIDEPMRCNERQLLNGTYPVVPGVGQGFYQNVVDGLNSLIGAKQISADATVQSVLDDMGYERDNN